MASLDGFAYSVFGWAGEALARMFPWLRSDIVSADMRVYPAAYASRVVLLSVLGFAAGLGVAAPVSFALAGVGVLSPLQAAALSAFLPLGVAAAVFGLGLVYPKVKLSSRASQLDLETAYLAVYVTVMATGGISPYTSFERLARAPETLFREVRREARRFFLLVRSIGWDPLSAIEFIAKRAPHEGFRQLLLGYAATLRVGGDVVHYLQRQTEIMLRERVSQVKVVGER
ncbi:MAG: type II secretion system F family protein, partial [Thermofilaceae archaeon]